jgi:hypothetical protein
MGIMKTQITMAVGLLLLGGCAAEKSKEPAASTTMTATAAVETVASTTTETAVDDNVVSGTFTGQIKVAQPISMFNYVGAESGDFAPMRFHSDSDLGRKILAACANDDECEFTGTVRWLDEAPPPDASAIGEIVTVESVKRVPPRM